MNEGRELMMCVRDGKKFMSSQIMEARKGVAYGKLVWAWALQNRG